MLYTLLMCTTSPNCPCGRKKSLVRRTKLLMHRLNLEGMLTATILDTIVVEIVP